VGLLEDLVTASKAHDDALQAQLAKTDSLISVANACKDALVALQNAGLNPAQVAQVQGVIDQLNAGTAAATAESAKVDTAVASDALPVDPIFAPALKEWSLYVLWGGDTDSSPNYSQAIGRKQTFFDLLQVKTASDKAATPNIKG
jgi:hypothetical protein